MIEEVIRCCENQRGAVRDYPFGPEPLVMKVGGKMFALISDSSISLKCDPVIAENLREQYDDVRPGYHMNKKHWNTVDVNGSILLEEINDMIEHSYRLVVKGLPKTEREKWMHAK